MVEFKALKLLCILGILPRVYILNFIIIKHHFRQKVLLNKSLDQSHIYINLTDIYEIF